MITGLIPLSAHTHTVHSTSAHYASFITHSGQVFAGLCSLLDLWGAIVIRIMVGRVMLAGILSTYIFGDDSNDDDGILDIAHVIW